MEDEIKINLIDEMCINDFNTQLLDKSGVKNFVNVIRDNKPMFNIFYLEGNNLENETTKSDSTTHLKIKQKIAKTSTYKISNSFSHGISINEEQKTLVKNAVVDEVQTNLSKLVTNKIKELSDITYFNSYNRFERILNTLYKWFGKKYIKKTQVKTVLDFITHLSLKLNKLFVKTRNFGKAYIICNLRVGTFLRSSSLFVNNGNIDSTSTTNPYFIGSIYSTKVFIDPTMDYYDNNNVYVSFNNNDNNSAFTAPFFCLYLQENGTRFEEIEQYNLGHYLESESYKIIQLSLRMALFTLGDNDSYLFDKIVVKLPKNI